MRFGAPRELAAGYGAARTFPACPARPGRRRPARAQRIYEGPPVRPVGNERLLQAAWRRLSRGAVVPGRDGAGYAVLYPGRPADGPGPDFRDAVLRGPDGRVMRGDVEIHVRASGWRAHGHHRDPRYNGVAFHVTGEPPAGDGDEAHPVLTASGRSLHLLVLAPPDSAGTHSGPAGTTHEAVRPPGFPEPENHPRLATPADLAAAGDQRFLGKSAGFSIALREDGGDAAAWASVLDCLGYSRNRRGFRRVATRLPWPRLRDALEAGADAMPLLLWAGGFGPKPRQLASISRVNDVTRLTGRPAPAWVPGGRPDNTPERRLAAAAALAGRWRADGPLENIIQAVRAATGPKDLIDWFLVSAGREADRVIGSGARALIGRGRAGEIVVNAALPIAHAWSSLADRWDVTEKAFQLYRDHPKLPGNAVTREMAALLARPGSGQGPGPEIRGAREQQGLILMYRAMTAGPLYVRPPVSAGAKVLTADWVSVVGRPD